LLPVAIAELQSANCRAWWRCRQDEIAKAARLNQPQEMMLGEHLS
jgi:hypothetical protein